MNHQFTEVIVGQRGTSTEIMDFEVDFHRKNFLRRGVTVCRSLCAPRTQTLPPSDVPAALTAPILMVLTRDEVLFPHVGPNVGGDDF